MKLERLARVEEWNPLSSDQVKVWLLSAGVTLPRHRKTKKPTADEKALHHIVTKHPELRVPLDLVLTSRAVSKVIGYLEAPVVGRDSRLHPQFLFTPETGRLSARAPNVMQVPRGRDATKRELANAIRSTVTATPGWVLGESDWKGIEALLVGWFAQDPDYMRLSRLGVHAFVASHVLGRPADMAWPDERLADFFAEIKANHGDTYDSSKVVVHGGNYLMGIPSIAENLGVSRAEASRLVKLYRDLAPGVVRWQQNLVDRAHADRKLVNPFGWESPYFFAVKEPGGRLGKQAYEAAAFLPQSTGASMLRRTILALDAELGQDPDFAVLTPIHDSFLWECREGKERHYVGRVEEIMSRPWAELDGLAVGVETKVGRIWSQLKTVAAA